MERQTEARNRAMERLTRRKEGEKDPAGDKAIEPGTEAGLSLLQSPGVNLRLASTWNSAKPAALPANTGHRPPCTLTPMPDPGILSPKGAFSVSRGPGRQSHLPHHLRFPCLEKESKLL